MGDDLELLDLLTGLVGGLALFLLGIQQLTRALQNLTSNRLRVLLVRLSGAPIRGALSGTLAAGLIQSSTATVVLVIGFVAAGAVPLASAVAIVLGANLGTTLTIQLIAFDVTRFALLMIGVGFGVSSVKRWSAVHAPARMFLALGLIFFGIDVMASAVEPLRELPALADVLAASSSLALALLAGAAVTAIVQSSSATSGIVVVLASQGLLDLHTGIAVLMGASIGTCITPIIAGLGTARSGLRVATAHTLINILGVGIAVWFIPQLADLAIWLSPTSEHLGEAGRAAADTPRQLANAYTLFKLAMLLAFLPVTRQLARLTERLIPGVDDEGQLGARYLDDDALDTPDVALELTRRELARLGEYVCETVEMVMPTVLHGSADDLEALMERDIQIDAIHEDLMHYLSRIGLHELSNGQANELLRSIAIANDLETIGDVVETNLVQIGQSRLAEGVIPSGTTTSAVGEFHALVHERLEMVVGSLTHADLAPAQEIVDTKHRVQQQRHIVGAHLVDRLRTDAPNRVRSYEREVEVVSHLQRIAGLTRHIARTLVSEHPDPTVH